MPETGRYRPENENGRQSGKERSCILSSQFCLNPPKTADSYPFNPHPATGNRHRWTVLPPGETFLDKSCSISYNNDVRGGLVRRLFSLKIRLFRYQGCWCLPSFAGVAATEPQAKWMVVQLGVFAGPALGLLRKEGIQV